MPITQEEEAARHRIRALRTAKGWSIDELSRRTHISASTISRIETGHRRLALDHLVLLARALETSVDELLSGGESAEDVVIRPSKNTANGQTYWMLNRDDSERIVAKMRIPAAKRTPEPRVHPGRDWFFVLEGTVRLLLGDQEHLVEAGQAAEFDTMTPHFIVGYGGPAEVLTIFDRHGEKAHLTPD